nr:secreted acidic protein 1A-like [Ipomoea trifida]
MAFRGRGRGRGGYGGGFRIAKQESFELFPKINDENLGNASTVTERVSLARWYLKLQNYWNSSPYYLGGESDTSKKTKSMDIERFSDKNSDRAKAKRPLSDFITVDPAYFPGELARGGRTGRPAAKRVRWSEAQDLQKLDWVDWFCKLGTGLNWFELKPVPNQSQGLVWNQSLGLLKPGDWFRNCENPVRDWILAISRNQSPRDCDWFLGHGLVSQKRETSHESVTGFSFPRNKSGNGFSFPRNKSGTGAGFSFARNQSYFSRKK